MLAFVGGFHLGLEEAGQTPEADERFSGSGSGEEARGAGLENSEGGGDADGEGRRRGAQQADGAGSGAEADAEGGQPGQLGGGQQSPHIEGLGEDEQRSESGSIFKCVWANEWDRYAASVYRKRFPGTPISTSDIRKVEADSIPDHDLLCGGFPCFIGGTLILTSEGFKPIEQVRVGDSVLTHLGRWKPVTATTKRRGAGRLIKGHGILPTVTTDEHPYFLRESFHEWDPPRRNYNRRFREPSWVPAKDAEGKHSLTVLPPEQQLDGDTDFWWIVGRYLADGWLVNRRDRGNGGVAKVIICDGKSSADELEKRIRRRFHCTRVEERTVVKFHITDKRFAEFLEAKAGRSAATKHLPPEWMGAPKKTAEAILDGYLSGDGHKRNGEWSATTISPSLALGIAMLSHNVKGVRATITANRVRSKTTIEGREVSQKPFYTIHIPKRNRSGVIEGRKSWGLIRVSKPIIGEEFDLYNLEVEGDNSYTANGAVVHNCQSFSLAGKRRGISDPRGALFREIARIAEHKRPKVLLLENVKGLLSAGVVVGTGFYRATKGEGKGEITGDMRAVENQPGRGWEEITETVCAGYVLNEILLTLLELGYGIEYQLQNSVWHGIPQNRERIFIVGHLGGQPRRTVFPVAEVGGEPAEAGGGAEGEGKRLRPANTLSARYGKDGSENLIQLGSVYEGNSDAGRVYDSGGTARTLKGESGGLGGKMGLYAVPVLTPDRPSKRQSGRRFKEDGEPSFTLTGQDIHGVMVPDVANAVDADGYLRFGGRLEDENGEKRLTSICERRIRRLTPVECERLQGFPDNFTAEGVLEDGTPVKISDSQRYKMCGNAVTTSVVKFLGKRLLKVMEGQS